MMPYEHLFIWLGNILSENVVSRKKLRVFPFFPGIARQFASYDLLRKQNGCFIKRLLVHIIIVGLANNTNAQINYPIQINNDCH